MKRIILFAAAAAMAAVSCSQYKYETFPDDQLGTKLYTLDNGLKVYMSVNKEVPRIQTYIAVKVGAKNDPPETTGLAHYFEHLMFKGTASFGTSDYEAEKPLLDKIESLFETYRQTTDTGLRTSIYHEIDSLSYEASKVAIPNEYDKLMAVIGADGSNAWTSHDMTVYTEDIPSNQIDNWARIQADRFKNATIRGFHTELETIYEEKNMSLTDDSDKVWEAMGDALFPHHPYGKQSVLGTQDHLKNPSITNVKKYHDTYYVPNNTAICLSGDFNPDEMVAAIEKYFGDWEPNPELPEFGFEKEQPLEAPVERTVYGLESEYMVIGWPLPGGNDLKDCAVAQIAGYILSNGQAGLLDLDLNQQQKVLGASGGFESQADYSYFIVMAEPKQGQSLSEVRDLCLAEVARLRDGRFDESMVPATINNIKLEKMKELEKNRSRALNYVMAFINGVDWREASREIACLEDVTKDDIIAWAGKYLRENGYAAIYKKQGADNSVSKISAPQITPIATNRDMQSDFLTEVQETKVKPVEPVFVDFDEDMSRFDLADGIEVLYKRNELNDIFNLDVIFNIGTENDPALRLAADYISYLGTEDMLAEDIAKRMYELACSFNFSAGSNQTRIRLSGLDENMSEAVRLVGDLIFNAKADETILGNLKADLIKSRSDSKLNQKQCFNALRNYIMYGPEFISRTTLSNDRIADITSEELFSSIRNLFDLNQEVVYYGPSKESAVKSALAKCLRISDDPQIVEESFPIELTTPENRVVMAPYDAKQLYYCQYSNQGRKFDKDSQAAIDLYNEYFGGGMNTVVFQEMREARGLAYSAWAYLSNPSSRDNDYTFTAFIATQNDKMQQAVEAFDSIIDEMPESETSFAIAKDALLSRLRTSRTTGGSVLSKYLQCRRMGLDKAPDEEIFNAISNMTMDDVRNVQQDRVKGNKYTYAILGKKEELDTVFLHTLGEVEVTSLEEIFGY